MTYFFKMVDIQMVLLIYLLVGVICRKSNIITTKNQGQFINFVLNIIMPCMVFNSFKSITLDILKQAFVALLISLGVCLFALVLSRMVYKSYSQEKQKILRYATLINNAGFAGLPLAQTIYGDKGLIYASIFLIPIRVFMWSAGITMLTTNKVSPKMILIRLATNVNIIAVVLGIARGLLQINLPTPIDSAISCLSSCVSPLSMIVIGAIISDVKLKGLFEKGVVHYSLTRLFFLPLLTLCICKLINIEPTIIGISVILTAMPAATSTSLLAYQNGLDETFASKLILVTTVASPITSPIIMTIIQSIS